MSALMTRLPGVVFTVKKAGVVVALAGRIGEHGPVREAILVRAGRAGEGGRGGPATLANVLPSSALDLPLHGRGGAPHGGSHEGNLVARAGDLAVGLVVTLTQAVAVNAAVAGTAKPSMEAVMGALPTVAAENAAEYVPSPLSVTEPNVPLSVPAPNPKVTINPPVLSWLPSHPSRSKLTVAMPLPGIVPGAPLCRKELG